MGNRGTVRHQRHLACFFAAFEETKTMITALIVICLVAGALTWFALTDFGGDKRNDKRNER